MASVAKHNALCKLCLPLGSGPTPNPVSYLLRWIDVVEFKV
jgi:hypothetical protein